MSRVEEIDGAFIAARQRHQEGDFEGAIAQYRECLAMGPHPHAPYLLGVALQQADQAAEAVEPLQQITRMRPGFLDGWLSLGDVHISLKQFAEAWQAYRAAYRLSPKNFAVCVKLAETLSRKEDWQRLKEFSDKMAVEFADQVELLRYRLQPRHALQQYVDGIFLVIEFLQLQPEDARVVKWYEELFGHIKVVGKDLIAELRKIDSDTGRILTIRALIRAKEVEAANAAFAAYERDGCPAARLNASNIGMIYKNEKLHAAAEPFLWQALESQPLNFPFLSNVIDNLLALAKSGRQEKFAEARELAQLWLDAQPENPHALMAMGSIYGAASRPELALPYQERLLAQNPNHPIRQSRLFSINYDERLEPDAVFAAHKEWGEWFEAKHSVDKDLDSLREGPSRNLRIGYISPDLGSHPVGTFFIDVLKAHDFENFEVFLYSNRYADEGDDARSRLFREAVGEEHWRWTRGLTVDDLCKQIRRDGIDILVEMAGHTAYNRLDVMARKAAPVQVEWLGYPNTTGLTRIDYRFSDAITEPVGDFDSRSTEKIYRLPNGFHMYSLPDYTPDPAPAPCLKNGYVTFGTFNNMNKLGSQSLSLWADLLKSVPKSRIIIKHATLAVLDNRESLRSELAKYGIQGWRVDLRETTAGHKQHLDSYGEIDIALDPLFYNGTTTTCDALSVGVPVLTLPGRTHSARVSASLLHRIGMDHWIAHDREHFLEIGRRAAQNFTMLNDMRTRIRQAFDASPLRDGAAMARDLENAYRDMWQALLISSTDSSSIEN